MKIIAVANLKGGVGKTTICNNLAGVLADRGKRVLLVDMDKQANLTSIYEASYTESQIDQNQNRSIARVFFDDVPFKDVIIPTPFDRISLVPSDPDLVELDAHFANDLNAHFLLADLLEEQTKHFDYVIIDCPPHTDMATRMSLVSAHAYFIPMDAHRFAYKGMQRLQDLVGDIQKRANRNLKFLGYVLSRIQSRRALTDRYIALFKNQLGDRLLPTQIKESIKFQEASSAGKPISVYLPASEFTEMYRQLAKDLTL